MAQSGTLFIVATPIGNLGDITPRALEVLGRVEYIAAEDTRTASKLLTRFNIKPPKLIAFEEHSESAKKGHLLEILGSGADIALVSESGAPLVSDPGYSLVREATKTGIKVVPVPGPSAVITALMAAGVKTDRFSFTGFLSRKREARKNELTAIADTEHTVIAFESPHRIEETLKDIESIMPQRRLVLCRELTKVYEEFIHGTAGEILENIQKRNTALKGEITLIFDKPEVSAVSSARKFSEREFFNLLTDHLNIKPSKAAATTAKFFSSSREEVYNKYIKKTGVPEDAD